MSAYRAQAHLDAPVDIDGLRRVLTSDAKA
jgi:hypothetical protein